MKPFGSFSNQKIIGLSFSDSHQEVAEGLESFRPHAEELGQSGKALVAQIDQGGKVTANELADQFLVFQWSEDPSHSTILTSNQIVPTLKGEKPDVVAKIELLSFHLSESKVPESNDDNAKAIMRIDLGQDESSNSSLDRVTNSILAGLDLYNQFEGKSTKPNDLKIDFSKAFAKRPIEVAGGLGKLRFEVCRLPEPTWWQKIFKWFQTDTARALTSALGFPGLTSQAVGVVDELINSLLGTDKPEILFQSRDMTLALTQSAKADFTGNIPSNQIGSLKPGICLLARGRDLAVLNAKQPIYRGEYGILVPQVATEEEIHSPAFRNPFSELTYAVFRMRFAETQISPF